MDLTITKEEFESVLYVATSKHMEVFESVQPHIENATEDCIEEFFGSFSTDNAKVIKCAKDYICVDAFLLVFRQLDLVLTPTGFGVVSNQTTSPASKQRVDALETQLRLIREKVKARLINRLTSTEGWGKTEAAKRCIRTVFYSISLFERYATTPVSFESWQEAQIQIMEADMKLRTKISDAQMDRILESVRNGTAAADYSSIIWHLQMFFSLYIAHSPLIGERMRIIIVTMEANPETYKEYMESDAYKINHYEPYKNKKDSPAFFFAG